VVSQTKYRCALIKKFGPSNKILGWLCHCISIEEYGLKTGSLSGKNVEYSETSTALHCKVFNCSLLSAKDIETQISSDF